MEKEPVLGVRVWGLGFRVIGFREKEPDFQKVSGFQGSRVVKGFRVQGLGFRV